MAQDQPVTVDSLDLEGIKDYEGLLVVQDSRVSTGPRGPGD